jgi:hypothetical protein
MEIRKQRSIFDETFCAHCRRSGGSFWRATYAGAPDRGVPVHIRCATEFFAKIDAASPFGHQKYDND